MKLRFTGDHKSISRNGVVILHVDPAGDRTGNGRQRLSEDICRRLNFCDYKVACPRCEGDGEEPGRWIVHRPHCQFCKGGGEVAIIDAEEYKIEQRGDA